MRRPHRSNLVLVATGWLLGLATVITCSRPAGEPSRPTGDGAPPAGRSLLPAPALARAASAGAGEATLADVAERVVPSVVNISASRVTPRFRQHPFFHDPMFRDFFGPMPHAGQPEQSLGSGVIVSRDGVVVTNNHVVDQTREIRVKLHDGRELEAEVVGTDPKADLAVLRIAEPPPGLEPLSFGDSDQLRLGDVVLAVGNPFGVGQTVTMGIVSGLGRGGMGLVDYEDFIQTDAAINPGNSGGALVNMRGELVGINTAILSRTGGYQGIGFAIPSSMARPVTDSLLAHGKVVRGFLGVSIQELDRDLASGLGLSVDRGALVSDVTAKSPAARAGLRRGDVIVEVDGSPITSTRALRNRIAATRPGTEVRLTLVRDGARRTVAVELDELPADEQLAAAGGGSGRAADEGALAGVAVGPLDAANRARFRIGRDVKRGVVVTRVEPGSPALHAGLRPGDVILELDRTAVDSVARFRSLYGKGKDAVLLLIQRGGATLFIAIKR